ncbi:MAG: hypothetical protein AVDCRST_MAG68-3008, partial [uncultured Gemmatimonadetes bacterium]
GTFVRERLVRVSHRRASASSGSSNAGGTQRHRGTEKM